MLNVNSGCDQAHIQHKPSLLSDNGRSYLFGDLTKRFSLASDLVCTRGKREFCVSGAQKLCLFTKKRICICLFKL